MPRERTILVVEDEASVRALLGLVLEDEGYRVETAANGCEALTKVRDHRPDAILLDLMMPVLDGAGFLRACRADPEYGGVPVVVMSAGSVRAPIETLDAQGVLQKPFGFDTLLAMLDSVL